MDADGRTLTDEMLFRLLSQTLCGFKNHKSEGVLSLTGGGTQQMILVTLFLELPAYGRASEGPAVGTQSL